MNLDQISEEVRVRFDHRMNARERALPAARRAIRSCANAIRAIHRSEWEQAHRLMDQAKEAIDEAVVAGVSQLPTPEELGVEDAPFLNGMAEAIGEGRRYILDLLRHGEVDRGEAILSAMDDIYYVLVSMDYPDAITMNLRRSTDVARSLIEKTRGDLSIAIVQRQLRDALDRHAKDVLGQ
jgi:translin